MVRNEQNDLSLHIEVLIIIPSNGIGFDSIPGKHELALYDPGPGSPDGKEIPVITAEVSARLRRLDLHSNGLFEVSPVLEGDLLKVGPVLTPGFEPERFHLLCDVFGGSDVFRGSGESALEFI